MTTAGTRLPPVLLLAVVLHAAVLPQLRVFDVAAELLLLLAVTAGLVAGPHRGATTGFVLGLLADCFLLTPFGLSALVYCLAGWAVGALHTTILHPVRWIPVATVFVASALAVVAYAAAGAATGYLHLVDGRLPVVVVVVGALNAVLSPAALRVMRWALVPDARRALAVR